MGRIRGGWGFRRRFRFLSVCGPVVVAGGDPPLTPQHAPQPRVRGVRVLGGPWRRRGQGHGGGEERWDRLGAKVEPSELLTEGRHRAALQEDNKVPVDLPGKPGETAEENTHTQVMTPVSQKDLHNNTKVVLTLCFLKVLFHSRSFK